MTKEMEKGKDELEDMTEEYEKIKEEITANDQAFTNLQDQNKELRKQVKL